MLRITVLFEGILYGMQKSVWEVPEERLTAVEDTIKHLTFSGLKTVKSKTIETIRDL